MTADQIVRELRQAIDTILRPAIIQALAECAETARHGIRRSASEEPDDRQRRLLRARRQRPRGRSAAERG